MTEHTDVLMAKMSEMATIPQKAHADDAGWDLYASEDVTIAPGDRKVIPLGVRMALETGWEAQIRPKSGMSAKGFDTAFGTIDAGYRGELKVTVINTTQTMKFVKVGDKVGQMVFARVPSVMITEVTEDKIMSLTSTRGEGGHGSTGTR